MKKKIYWIIFLTILIIGIVIRVYQLGSAPISVFGDEIDVGIQANSILQTGKDYFGNPYPIMFQSFSEYRLPLFIYSAVPFIKIFGLSEFGVRATAVFWGSLGLIGIFFLGKEMFGRKIGLIALLLLVLSPWHIQYSRQAGIESIVLLTLVTFAVLTFLKGLKSFKWLIISAVLFTLTIYAYATAILITPILILFLVIFFRKNFSKYFNLKKIIILGLAIFIVALPYINLYISGRTQERFSTLWIGSDQSLIKEIVERRNYDNSPLAPFFHNKPLVYLYEGISNYLESLSPEFLFLKGDPNLRHSVSSMGEMYFFDIILLCIGIYLAFKRKGEYLILLAWLLISPIAASLTRDGGYHASRLITMLAPLILFSAVGLGYLIDNYKKHSLKIILGVVLVMAFFNIATYFHRYYNDYRQDSWRFWQYGYKEAFDYIKANESNYQDIVITNAYEPVIPRFMFWWNYDPKKIQQEIGKLNQLEPIPEIKPGFEGYVLDNKYYFGNITEKEKWPVIRQLITPKNLYMISFIDEASYTDFRTNPPPDVELLKTIVSPDGQLIFFILTAK